MESLVWESEPPELRTPVLVAAFAGWNDAAGAATTALETVAAALDSEVVAEIDPEEFYDFQANRPIIQLSEGQSRHIEWPANRLLAAEAPAAERDLLLLHGTEPSTRWRTFSAAILDAAERCDVEMVVTLGALIADVAHTRPVPVTGLASDPQLVEQLGVQHTSYEGPTGIVGVLHDACRRRSIPSVSLWAAVPHYAAAVPNPTAALALLRRLEGLLGVAIEGSELEEASLRFDRKVDGAVEANPEIAKLVRQLEERQAESFEFGEDVPSGDVIAGELQRFLLQREEGE